MLDFFKKSVALRVASAVVLTTAILMILVWATLLKIGYDSLMNYDRSMMEQKSDALLKEVMDNLITSARTSKHNLDFCGQIINLNPMVDGLVIVNLKGQEKIKVGRFTLSNPIWFEKTLSNEKACQSCHSNGADRLGTLRVAFVPPSHSTFFTPLKIVSIAASLIFLFFLCVIIIYFFQKYFKRPLEKLSSAIAAAEKGNFLIRAPVERKDEIGVLAEGFNKMMSKLTDYNVNIIEAKRELDWTQKELELKKELGEKNTLIEETNKKLEKRLQELSMLVDITQTINSTIDLEEVLSRVCTVVGSTLGIEEFAVLLYNESTGQLEVKATHGFPDPEKIKGLRFNKGEGISGRVFETRDPILIQDTSADERYLHYKGRRITKGSFLSIPVNFKGKVIGVLNFNRSGVNSFTETDIKLLNAIAHQAAMAIGNAQLYFRTKEMAIHDELTGLYNRRFMMTMLDKEVKRAQRFNREVSILMMDIDFFKSFNDEFGHIVGDRVLRKIGRILKRKTRKIDTVARYGGEEFVAILPNTTQTQAYDVAEKLRNGISMAHYPEISSHSKSLITVSIGIATCPGDADDHEKLIHAADMALYKAKKRGRNQVAHSSEPDAPAQT